MNNLVLIAGILSVFVVAGHFKFGISWYLKPMIEADFKPVAKATMQSVFHYVSVYLIISAISLVAIGSGKASFSGNIHLVKFIGFNYLFFGFVQVFYSFKNKIEKPLITMFQWTMFIPIGILCILAAGK